MSGYIGVDLDGTLAHYDGDVSSVGDPVPRMLERVRVWLAQGTEVRIVTARVSPEWNDVDHQQEMIRAWCLEHLGVELVVQCHKSGGLIELWDDRAVGVVSNEGMRRDEIQYEAGRVTGVGAIRLYDRRHDIEGDARADVEAEQLREHPEWPAKINESCICVDMMTDDDIDDEFYVNPREARCLAAQLLRAADEADAAIAAEPGAELRR